MENKPKVFPTAEQIAEANRAGEELAKQQGPTIAPHVSPGEAAAAAEMLRRTEEQLRLREEKLKQLEQKKAAESVVEKPIEVVSKPIVSPMEKIKPINSRNVDQQIQEISQPQMNQPYDIIPLPSEGKVYKNKKGKVKVAYLTASDENILTSPHLLDSGDFLEILINRKLLEFDLRYKDLLPGDRDAIMIWLRATGYGEMYPVSILDENNTPFDTEIDLSTLQVKKLNVEPDADGLFTFTLPTSKSVVRFKLLTVGDIEHIEQVAQFLKEENNIINVESTLMLENQIVEIDGNTDKEYISEFIENMRLLDSKKLKEYIKSIECGVDTNIVFQTPGGGSVTRFLPFTLKFFWPDFEI
jgi:hypothetical protein